MVGYWINNTVCGEPKWESFRTFTVSDVKRQCSNCPTKPGTVWRDGLFVGNRNPIYDDEQNCPLCFSGPLLE